MNLRGEIYIMMSKKIISTLALSVLGVSVASTPIYAATQYKSATDVNTTVEAEITMDEEGEIPTIDGTEVLPIDPSDLNIDRAEGLSIRYASGLNFGEAEFSTEAHEMDAAQDFYLDEEGEKVFFDNMVTVEDIRGVRDGWSLTVSQVEEFMEGAEIKLTPTVGVDTLGVTGSAPFSVNIEGAVFATASNQEEGKAGVISIGMGDVKLAVPANAGVGSYEGTLNWNLTNGPQA